MKLNFIFNCILFLFCTSIVSQNSNKNLLEEVVLTDSRFSMKRSQSGKTIIKISVEEIEEFQGRSLSDLLSTYGAINILGSKSYSGQNLTFSIRGGRNRQVLILIDGVRVSDPSRIDDDFNLNFLNLNDIESIEIIKGAASTLYGASAASGVINIITKSTENKLNININSTVGTENKINSKFKNLTFNSNSIYIGGNSNNFNYKLYISNKDIKGMSAISKGIEKDPYAQFNYGFNIGNKESKFIWKLSVNKDFINSNYDNIFLSEDADFKLITELKRISFNHSYNYQNGSVNLNSGFQKTSRNFQSNYPFQTLSSNLYFDLFDKHIFNEKLYTIVGLNFKKSNADYEGSSVVNQKDFYANFVYLSSIGFQFNAGSRLNNHSAYGSHLTYSLNPSYTFRFVNHNLKILTSYSTAFIAPSLYQIYDKYSGNTNLKPEENSTFEYGIEWNFLTKTRASLVFYKRNQNPSLVYDFASFRYVNSNKNILYNGIEFEYQNTFLEIINFRMNFTYSDSKKGNLTYLPKTKLNIFTDIDISDKTKVNMIFQKYSSRMALDKTLILDGFSLLDLRVSYQLKNKLTTSFYLWLTNILDKEYIEQINYNSKGRNFKSE